jgi:hypothetical protein
MRRGPSCHKRAISVKQAGAVCSNDSISGGSYAPEAAAAFSPLEARLKRSPTTSAASRSASFVAVA